MELGQLRHFVSVAEHRSFTQAAAALQVSQPALSRSVAKLEEDLGQPVFERQARGLELTDAGRTLLPRAQQILALVDDARAEITDDGRTGRVRIGAIPTIAPYLLPALLRGFAAEFPHASLLVQEDTTERLLQRCRDGEVDVALIALPAAASHLEVSPMFAEELRVVLPPEHPLAELPQLTPGDLEPYPFVLLDEAHCLSEHVVSYCRQRQVQPLSMERTSQLATVQELVALGHGVSLIPEMAERVDAGPRRVYRSMAEPRPQRTIAVAWNPYRFQSKLCQAFRAFAQRHSSEIAS